MIALKASASKSGDTTILSKPRGRAGGLGFGLGFQGLFLRPTYDLRSDDWAFGE